MSRILRYNSRIFKSFFSCEESERRIRLVTVFAEVGRYSKPQHSLMPDVDSTLCSIVRWKYLITSDLTNAFCFIRFSCQNPQWNIAESPHTLDELLSNWKRVLDAPQKSNLKFSHSKTVICPRSATILGWIWTQGVLSASPHRIAVLAKFPPPDTVRGLPSFIGAYKYIGTLTLYLCRDRYRLKKSHGPKYFTRLHY